MPVKSPYNFEQAIAPLTKIGSIGFFNVSMAFAGHRKGILQ